VRRVGANRGKAPICPGNSSYLHPTCCIDDMEAS
jgi:hypothetical protein